MRAPVLLVAAALALSACTSAQGATAELVLRSPAPAPSASAGTPPAAPAPAPSTPTSPAPSSSVASSPPASTSVSASPEPSAPAPVASSPSPPVSLIDPAALGGPAPVGAFVLGDSISLSAGVGPVLAHYGYPVVGKVGQGLSEFYLRSQLTTPSAQAAPAWVLELGTNNRGDATDVAGLAHAVDLIDALRTPGAKQKVLWVTPHRPEAYVGGLSAWNLDEFNRELSRLAQSHRWLRILDFDLLAKQHPEWFDQDTAMHVHPDAAGQATLVELIAGPDPRPAAIPATVLDAGAVPSASTAPAEDAPVFDNSADCRPDECSRVDP